MGKLNYLFITLFLALLYGLKANGHAIANEETEDLDKKYTNSNIVVNFVGIVVIFFSSFTGTMIPVIFRKKKFFASDSVAFCSIKLFGIGVIISVAFIHMLIPANQQLNSPMAPYFFKSVYTSFTGVFAIIGVVITHIIQVLANHIMKSKATAVAASTSTMSTMSSPKKDGFMSNSNGNSGYCFNQSGSGGNSGSGSGENSDSEQTVVINNTMNNNLHQVIGNYNTSPKIKTTTYCDLGTSTMNTLAEFTSRYNNSSSNNISSQVSCHNNSHGNSNSSSNNSNNVSNSNASCYKLNKKKEKSTADKDNMLQDDCCGNGMKAIFETMENKEKQLVGYLLEFGISLHSVLIGVVFGLATNQQSVALLVAMIFHQFFEGVALSSIFLEAKFKKLNASLVMVAIFSVAMPFGTCLGLLIHEFNDMNTGVMVALHGGIDAVAAGILIFDALANVLVRHTSSEDWKKFSLQNKAIQLFFFYLGLAVMALIGVWA